MPNNEKRKELTRQIIIRVKEVIEDMTDSEVVQRMEEAGEQTSLSTVRRIRAEGSEDAGFNYNLTVKPFAKVFLELSSKPVDVEAFDSEEGKDRAALVNMIQLKNLEIDSLRKDLNALETQLSEVKEAEQRKIAHLKGQIEKQDSIIENHIRILDDRKEFMGERRDFIFRLEAEKKTLRKTITILAVLLALCVLLIISALIVDVMNPDAGFFWVNDIVAKMNTGDLVAGPATRGFLL